MTDKPRQTALVTGGAVRIGQAIALALAHDGLDVVIQYRHSQDAAEATAQLIRDSGRRAWTVYGAFEHVDTAEAVFNAALTHAGRIDVLVNNASVLTRGSLAETTADAFESAWRINALSPILLARAFAAHIHDRGFDASGCVVNLLDQRITGCFDGRIAYGLSKRVLAGFTRDAAMELAPHIRLNAVAPGPVLPPPDGVPEQAGTIPLERRPTPQEIADAVLYLIKARSVTGQILFVDGGQHLVRG